MSTFGDWTDWSYGLVKVKGIVVDRLVKPVGMGDQNRSAKYSDRIVRGSNGQLLLAILKPKR